MAKRTDGSLVAVYMWDARITAVFSSFTTSVLSKIRRYVLTHRFQIFYKEFITFMSNIYKTFWITLILDGDYLKIHTLGGGGRLEGIFCYSEWMCYSEIQSPI